MFNDLLFSFFFFLVHLEEIGDSVCLQGSLRLFHSIVDSFCSRIDISSMIGIGQKPVHAEAEASKGILIRSQDSVINETELVQEWTPGALSFHSISKGLFHSCLLLI